MLQPNQPSRSPCQSWCPAVQDTCQVQVHPALCSQVQVSQVVWPLKALRHMAKCRRSCTPKCPILRTPTCLPNHQISPSSSSPLECLFVIRVREVHIHSLLVAHPLPMASSHTPPSSAPASISRASMRLAACREPRALVLELRE